VHMKYLFIGGNQHGKVHNLDRRDRWVFPKPVYPLVFREAPEIPVSRPYEDLEVYKLERLGDPKTRVIKELYVIEGISGDKALELLNIILLERFINESY